MRCVHCDADRRGVSLWGQIIDLGRDVVCCLLEPAPHIVVPRPRGWSRA